MIFPPFRRLFSSCSFSSLVARYGQLDSRGVTLRQMFAVGPQPSPAAILSASHFVHRELPIRLARRLLDFEAFQFSSPELANLQAAYRQSFQEAVEIPRPSDQKSLQAFTALVERILSRDFAVRLGDSLSIGAALRGRPSGSIVPVSLFALQEFLERLTIARIGLRMILSQQRELQSPRCSSFVGLIGKCQPLDLGQAAAEDAARICRAKFGNAPSVRLTVRSASKLPLTIRFVPEHFKFLVFELLKEAMRQTVAKHGHLKELPIIEGVLVDGDAFLTLKLSDAGGGSRRDDLSRVFSYAPLAPEGPGNVEGPPVPWLAAPLSPLLPVSQDISVDRFSFSLPLARLYARYFGGDLSLFSVPGFGADAHLTINKAGNAEELKLD